MTSTQPGIEVTPIPLKPITQPFLQELHATRTIALVGYTIVAWEFGLTFKDEVKYIWPTRLSIVKAIFLVNRYGNLCYHALVILQLTGTWPAHSPQFCFRFLIFMTSVIFVTYASIHVLILLRAWAMWAHRRRIASILIVTFCIYAAMSLAFVVYGISGAQAFAPLGVCFTVMPPWLWCMWLPGVLLDIGVFLLTVVSLRRSWKVHSLSPLINRLARDASIYFLFTLFSNIFNIIVWGLYRAEPFNVLTATFTLGLVNAAGQRLVLSLREADGYERVDDVESPIYFAHPTSS